MLVLDCKRAQVEMGEVTAWTRLLVAVLSIGRICRWMGCKLPEEGRGQGWLQRVWMEQLGSGGSETDDRFEKPSGVVCVSRDCLKKVPQSQWLKTHLFLVFQF